MFILFFFFCILCVYDNIQQRRELERMVYFPVAKVYPHHSTRHFSFVIWQDRDIFRASAERFFEQRRLRVFRIVLVLRDVLTLGRAGSCGRCAGGGASSDTAYPHFALQSQPVSV